jgi:hypothetical protein
MAPPDRYPPLSPRGGPAGAWDRLIGPGASQTEQALVILTALGAVTMLLVATPRELGWLPRQWIVAAILAADLAGGVVANATGAAKRWYHRPGQRFAQHMSFVAIHLVHPFLVAWLFRGLDWTWFGAACGYLLLGALIILRAPAHLQRAVSLLVYMGALLLALVVLTPTPGLIWFLPVFYLKLQVSHLPQELPSLR